MKIHLKSCYYFTEKVMKLFCHQKLSRIKSGELEVLIYQCLKIKCKEQKFEFSFLTDTTIVNVFCFF